MSNLPEGEQHGKMQILDSCMELMKFLKYTTDIMIDNKLYEKEEKFQTFSTQKVGKHPFGLILTRLAKIMSMFSFDCDDKILAHFDELLEYNTYENLDIIIFFTKPLDESD